jgi:hypothetical protein
MKYTCSMCKGVCESQWTEAEAIAEKNRDFGNVPLEECDIVCDDCYQQISPKNNPDVYADYRASVMQTPLGFAVPLPTAIELADTEVIRAYVDAELSLRLAEIFDQEERELLFGNRNGFALITPFAPKSFLTDGAGLFFGH